VDKKHYL